MAPLQTSIVRWNGCSLQSRAGRPARLIACIWWSCTQWFNSPADGRTTHHTLARLHDDPDYEMQRGQQPQRRRALNARKAPPTSDSLPRNGENFARCSLLGPSFAANQQPLAAMYTHPATVVQKCNNAVPTHHRLLGTRATCAPQSQIGGECHVGKEVSKHPKSKEEPRLYKYPANRGSQHTQTIIPLFIYELGQVRVPDSVAYMY